MLTIGSKLMHQQPVHVILLEQERAHEGADLHLQMALSLKPLMLMSQCQP